MDPIYPAPLSSKTPVNDFAAEPAWLQAWKKEPDLTKLDGDLRDAVAVWAQICQERAAQTTTDVQAEIHSWLEQTDAPVKFPVPNLFHRAEYFLNQLEENGAVDPVAWGLYKVQTAAAAGALTGVAAAVQTENFGGYPEMPRLIGDGFAPQRLVQLLDPCLDACSGHLNEAGIAVLGRLAGLKQTGRVRPIDKQIPPAPNPVRTAAPRYSRLTLNT
jgi:hypothetical protein